MNKNKSLPRFILLMMEKTIDGYVRAEDFLNNPGYYAYGGGWEYPLKKAVIAKAIKRLSKNGLIDVSTDENLMLRLTDSGKDRALWIKMKENKEKWDGKWRLVFWDIPEKSKTLRNLLRYKLKQLGFIKWQKSVWASKIDCTKELRDYIKKIGIENWVLVVESDNIGRNI